VTLGVTVTSAAGCAANDSILIPISGAAPVINLLSATPLIIQRGQTTTVSWDVSGVTEVLLSPDIGPRAPSGTIINYQPLVTTTLTLTATNSCGTVSQSVTIIVTP